MPDDNTDIALQRIENALGHYLHFTRTVEGTLTDISATGGMRVHLHYEHPLGRLTDVRRVVDNEAVETLGGQPRVVEHWTSDGEHYHFRYDLKARTTWTTDLLGRELEIHYNEDHRVTSSRDFGGEHYVIDLDDNGNMTGITLPDGNRLTLKYDEYARLIEETDPLGRTIKYKHHMATPLITETTFPDGSV